MFEVPEFTTSFQKGQGRRRRREEYFGSRSLSGVNSGEEGTFRFKTRRSDLTRSCREALRC